MTFSTARLLRRV